MNPRKRKADTPLLPLHSKLPRTRMLGYDGGNPSPSEDAGLLSRWKTFGKQFGMLVADTAKAVVYGTQQDQPEGSKSSAKLNGIDRTCPELNQQLPAPDFSRPRNIPSPRSDYDEAACSSSTAPYPPSTPPRPSIHRHTQSSQMLPPATFGRLKIDDALSSKSKAPNGVISRSYQNRPHIYAKAHKASVRAEIQKSREEMQRKIYQMERKRGYTSNFTDFQSFLAFQAKLEKIDQRDAFSPSSSMIDLPSTSTQPSLRRHSYSDNDDMEFLRRAFDRAKATLNEPQPPKPFQPSLEQLKLSHRLRDQDIEQLLRPKPLPPKPLSPHEDAQVDVILKKRGVVSKYAREQVNDQDLSRLRPSQWLNDELINFYGAMILGRSEDCKENPPKKGSNLMNVYYFSTFFWAKLKEGYEKGRLAKWTKKVDLFSKDLVLIPINHSNAHWTGAAINFRRKRIESYDSMGTRRDVVFKQLRMYLDAEHRNKKKRPFDFSGWDDYSIEEPLQENGYDCGVFTCQFLQGLSRGDEFVRFTQKDMPHLRRRMIWEIGNATLREDP